MTWQGNCVLNQEQWCKISCSKIYCIPNAAGETGVYQRNSEHRLSHKILYGTLLYICSTSYCWANLLELSNEMKMTHL